MSLELQQAFGLRREESIKFQPSYADRGDCIVLLNSWAKGGRVRTVPITTPEQRAVLDRAHALAGAGSLIPAHKNYIQQGLLSPERVERMAKEMRASYVEHQRALQTREAERPQELQELTARIERLRERLRRGDPDMTPAEIQVAIERAEVKARELGGLEAASTPAMKAFTMLPKAAEAYRRQITLGLQGEPRAALKARLILRELFGGEIRLVPEPDGGLTAHWNLHTSALVKTLGTSGSGGVLWTVPPIPQSVRLK